MLKRQVPGYSVTNPADAPAHAAERAAAPAVRPDVLTMRKLLLLAVLLPLAASAQGVALVDRIVAVVNKDVITATELDDAVAGAERQLRRQGTRAARARAARAPDARAPDHRQGAAAARQGHRPARRRGAARPRGAARGAEQQPEPGRLPRARSSATASPFQAWREELREQMLLNRLREREVDDRIQVSDTEIDLFLAD